MLDRVTEIVAHMIGVFHTATEETRLRDLYLKAEALRIQDPNTGALIQTAPTLDAPYQLEDFKPSGRYEDTAPPLQQNMDFTLFTPQTGYWAQWVEPTDGLPVSDPKLILLANGAAPWPILMLEPPGSVVTITYQHAFLTDNDVLRLTDTPSVFIDPSLYDTQLRQYEAFAETLSAPLTKSLPALGVSALDHAMQLHTEIGAVEDAEVSGADVTVLHGEAASGIFVNGVAAETMVRLEDVTPAHHQVIETAETGDDPDAPPDWAPSPYDVFAAAAIGDAEFDSGPTHELVSGGNMLINQTNITFAWLDAPVIAVMGDVVHLNIIAQTNLLVEHGQYNGIGAATGSATYNVASITLVSSNPDGVEPETAAGTLPLAWAVTRIDGNLLTVNHVQQYSFVTDHDRADAAFYNTETYIQLGDNTIFNITDLLEIGYGYDLIIIGGNMITINQINQMNVLIDNDSVTYSGILPSDFSAGDNLLFNGASITVTGIDSYQKMQANFAAAGDDLAAGGSIGTAVAHDSVFEGTDILRVLYISGDATTINLVDQTNILGDSDQVHLAMDNFQSSTGADISITTGSNVTANLASISQFGTDSTVMVGGDTYDDALIYQAGFIDTDANPNGVALPALANEAVAFLAEDMIGTEAPEDLGIHPTAIDAAHTPDVMQSMLA